MSTFSFLQFPVNFFYIYQPGYQPGARMSLLSRDFPPCFSLFIERASRQ